VSVCGTIRLLVSGQFPVFRLWVDVSHIDGVGNLHDLGAGPHGARPVGAEIVGLVPERALDGWPDALPITGFDPAKHVIERRLRV